MGVNDNVFEFALVNVEVVLLVSYSLHISCWHCYASVLLLIQACSFTPAPLKKVVAHGSELISGSSLVWTRHL